ncbi:MAG: hypothetical protein AAFY36_18435 [Bacteroidota bacterium]
MKNISIYSVLLLLTMVVWSCDHDTETFDGPNLVDRFGPFNILADLEVNRTTVDFGAGEDVRMTARFNKNVNFVIRITGMESGAVKTIEAFDSELNASNAIWDGGTTELPLFREEMCRIELIIPEENNLTQEAMVEIVSTRVYEGSLFTDFEDNPGTDIELGNFEFELTNETGRRSDGTAAQGDWFYLFEGTDNVVGNFFVGLININSTITGNTYAPVPTTVPEDLWFNAFLYADGGPHGIAVIQFVYDSNDSGAFEDGQDQTFQVDGDYPLGFEGWRHINHTMADIGMTEEQVSKIVAIRALLISDMNSQPNPPLQVDFGLDFLTFTSGGPLEL